MPPVSPRCTEEPLVEPFRTAVRAEMAKSGHALHPSICRSDAPELGVVVVRVGVTGKLVVKMNIPVAVRNATTPNYRYASSERIKQLAQKNQKW